MSKKPPKPKEDDDLDGVRRALEVFDRRAKIGKYKMDKHISRIQKARSLPEDHYAVRRALYRSAHSALGQKFQKTIGRPRDEAATQKFFSALQGIVELNRRIQDYETASAFSVTSRRDLNGGRTVPSPADLDEQIGKTEGNIEAIKTSCARTVSLIEEFTRATHIPKSEKRSSRIIFFTYYFIERFALEWRGIVGATPSTEDLSDMTALMAATLSDLKYPLLPSHLERNEWLSDRIRTQLFPESKS
ncbi:hypothetical protein [Bradyrhizobium sp. URHC0002]